MRRVIAMWSVATVAAMLLVRGAWFVAVARAQETQIVGLPSVELGPQEANVWEHRIGPETAVHLSTADYLEAKTSRQYLIQDYVEFEIVVSENGRVDSAKPVGDSKLEVEEARQVQLARVYKPWMRDGVPIRVKVHDYVQLLPPERWAAVRVPFPETWDDAGLRIGLKRTGCFGSCPGYEVTIAGDGTVRFSGDHFVTIPGDHVAHIPPAQVKELVDQFRKADFLSALDRYSYPVSDNPTQTLTLTINGTTKTVVDYVGIKAGLPLAIRNLEEAIDEAAGTKRWVKGDERTLASLEEEKWPFAAQTQQNVAVYDSAISTKNMPLVERYLKAGGPIQSPDSSSPVCVASGMGDLDLVQRMIEPTATKDPAQKRPVVSQGTKDWCLLSSASSGRVAMLQFWLDRGANPIPPPVKSVDPGSPGQGILVNGIFSGKAEMVKKLLEYKVDVHEKVQDEPLLTFALQRGDKETPEIVELLVKAGADVNARNWMGETPIFAANYTPRAIKPLLDAGADIEARNTSGDTALIRYGFMEPMVRELLADGADPAAVANNGDTPLKTAKQYGCSPCATLIEEALKKRAAAANAR